MIQANLLARHGPSCGRSTVSLVYLAEAAVSVRVSRSYWWMRDARSARQSHTRCVSLVSRHPQ